MTLSSIADSANGMWWIVSIKRPGSGWMVDPQAVHHHVLLTRAS
jgi:hypothetical protein